MTKLPAFFLILSCIHASPALANDRILVYTDIAGYDCPGKFGKTFDDCKIVSSLETKQASAIAAYEAWQEGSVKRNTRVFPDVEVNSIKFEATNSALPTNKQINGFIANFKDTWVKYWATHLDREFRLHWYIPNTSKAIAECGLDRNSFPESIYEISQQNLPDCLALAEPVRTGYYTAPENDDRVCHITFYGIHIDGAIPTRVRHSKVIPETSSSLGLSIFALVVALFVNRKLK